MLFRPSDIFSAIRVHAMPRLRTYPSIRLWAVSCGSGADAYALAIVLKETGLLERARVYATDVDPSSFADAQRGLLPESSLDLAMYKAAGGRSALAEYAQEGGEGVAVMRPSLSRRLFFSAHDASQESSFNEFQLIYCQELPGSTDHEKRRALTVLEASLCRFGMLAIGKEPARLLQPIDGYDELTPGLYRRTR